RLREEMDPQLDKQPFHLASDRVANLERYQFGPADQPVLSQLEARAWTMDELLTIGGHRELDLRMILYALSATDMLQLAGGAAVASPMPPMGSGPRPRPVSTPVPFTAPTPTRPGSYRMTGMSSPPRRPPSLGGASPIEVAARGRSSNPSTRGTSSPS